ncbi:MAG: MmcQ/YjbR family DNA-binding protein [Acidimicrobiales bacterium]|nr:MmcQ/YjbR family DNA-binding protein [Acidimicrobiales bacterium]
MPDPETRSTATDDRPPAAIAGEERFWELAEPLLARPDVTRSTMMGFPCLRVRGQFFASTDRRTGGLLVKLPEGRVDALVEAGRADDFAPAGRRFREWAAVPYERRRSWRALLDEAHDFVATLPAKPKPTPKRRARS